MSLSYEDWFGDYTQLMPVMEIGDMGQYTMLQHVHDDTGNSGIENDPKYRKLMESTFNAALKLHQRLCLLVGDKINRISCTLTKKAVSVFSRSRARSFRSRRKTASASSSSGDDDGGGDSPDSDPDPDPDPPALRYYLSLNPFKKIFNSFPLPVVPPRHMLRALSEGRAA